MILEEGLTGPDKPVERRAAASSLAVLVRW